MSEYIYTNFGIDKSRLKRDYIENPLKKGTGGEDKGEIPYKEDLEYLYIELNLPRYNLEKLFQRCSRTIKIWCNKLNVHKNSTQIYQNIIKTNLKKYNTSNPQQNPLIKLNWKLKFKEKYGVENPSQLFEVKEKKYQTALKNGTIGKSKEEDKIYKLLCQKYKEVKRQYKSDLYPFACDFYIPEIDTYIEYQGFWTHGKEPYIGTDKQKEKVKLWESKNTPQYNKAINDWTNKDALKRKTAKNNSLKWLEFFSFTEFEKWFNKSFEE